MKSTQQQKQHLPKELQYFQHKIELYMLNEIGTPDQLMITFPKDRILHYIFRIFIYKSIQNRVYKFRLRALYIPTASAAFT